jgi:prepilin-type N-terminal cleavage/methylation domain-containing protein
MIYKNLKKGFTLIELLIVIAILGVLAVVVLVAINPLEQLAKTRDAGRQSSVTQIGHAVQAYYTSQNAVYPPEATWNTALTGSGELSALPGSITATGYTACTGNVANGWCYKMTAASGAIVYAVLESKSQTAKCAATEFAFALYSTLDGRGGVVCAATASTVLVPGTAWAFK